MRGGSGLWGLQCWQRNLSDPLPQARGISGCPRSPCEGVGGEGEGEVRNAAGQGELPAGAWRSRPLSSRAWFSDTCSPSLRAGESDAGATLTSSPEAFPPGPSHRPYTEAIRAHRVLLLPFLSPSHQGGAGPRPGAGPWLRAPHPGPGAPDHSKRSGFFPLGFVFQLSLGPRHTEEPSPVWLPLGMT